MENSKFGVPKHKIIDAYKLAKENDLFIRTEITKKLGLLVCGDNAGPSKLKKASEMNIPKVYGIDGLNDYLDTGEYIY